MPMRKKVSRAPRRTGRKLNPRQKREVKAIIGKRIETKTFPLFANNTVTTTASIVDISSIAEGDNWDKRVGSSVVLKGIDFQWAFTCGDSYNTMRCILFRWNVDDTVDGPSLGQILDDSGGAGYRVYAPHRYDTRSKYHIMYDKVLRLTNQYAFTSAGALTSSIAQQGYTVAKRVRIRGRKKLGRMRIDFERDTSNGVGRVFAMFVSDSTVLPNPGFIFSGQLYYTDA